MTAVAKARFSQLVLPRLDEGYRLARWLSGSPTDAEDIMQEASLRAFRAIEGFAEGNVRAWFLTIVRNRCYSWLERHRSHAVVSSEDLSFADRSVMESGGATAPPSETPESMLIGKEQRGHLARAVDSLPAPLREVLVLREYHGLSYREIAEVANVPIGTVMSRLARARQHLIAIYETDRP